MHGHSSSDSSPNTSPVMVKNEMDIVNYSENNQMYPIEVYYGRPRLGRDNPGRGDHSARLSMKSVASRENFALLPLLKTKNSDYLPLYMEMPLLHPTSHTLTSTNMAVCLLPILE